MPDIRTRAYCMTQREEDFAEITLYGDIYESQPRDYWTGNPIEGQYILLDEFLRDLETIAGCKNILIRMNSYGGDAGVSLTIHNRLRELSNKGTELTCIVDGVAMSGGSLIMCACDKVQVYPGSLVMIHKSWSFVFGGYNADELREKANQSDAWDKMQIAIYKRKTGLSETVLRHMMSDITYMTGEEAMEKGFADELAENAEPIKIAASADGRTLMVNGRSVPFFPGVKIPGTIPVMSEVHTSVAINTPVETGSEGGTHMANNLEELRVENPELANQLLEEARAEAAADNTAAVAAERQRICEIDALAHLFDAQTVQDAKYDNPCTAQEMTYRAALASAQAGTAFMQDMLEDGKESNAGKVKTAVVDDDKPMTAEERMEQGRANARRMMNKED